MKQYLTETYTKRKTKMYEKEIEELEEERRTAVVIDGEYLYVIYESIQEEGYMVDKYDIHDDLSEPMDGGLCTGSAKDALEFML